MQQSLSMAFKTMVYLVLLFTIAWLGYGFLVRYLGFTDQKMIALFLAVMIFDTVIIRHHSLWRRPDGQKKTR